MVANAVMDVYSIRIMSLINQMLRDLESRKTIDKTSLSLPDNIQVTQSPKSKMRFVWGLMVIIATGGTYWAYHYGQALIKKPSAIVIDAIKKFPTPIVSYEKVLAAPNAVTETAPISAPKPQENIAVQPVPQVVQAVPVVRNDPVIERKPAENTSTQAVVQTPPVVRTGSETERKLPENASTQAVLPIVRNDPVVRAAPELTAKPAIKSIPTAFKSVQNKSITTKQEADVLYRQAENMPGNLSATALKLEQALKLDPRHLKARLLLAKTLNSQGRVYKTAEFLDQSLELFPDNPQLVNSRAQLFLQQKNPGAALKMLQRLDLTENSNETYLSLLAATYQQLQSFANAAKIYQKLVAINPEKAENWLGLALSEEKLGNLKLTREAYQQALSKKTLKESIMIYIKQRLVELK